MSGHAVPDQKVLDHVVQGIAASGPTAEQCDAKINSEKESDVTVPWMNNVSNLMREVARNSSMQQMTVKKNKSIMQENADKTIFIKKKDKLPLPVSNKVEIMRNSLMLLLKWKCFLTRQRQFQLCLPVCSVSKVTDRVNHNNPVKCLNSTNRALLLKLNSCFSAGFCWHGYYGIMCVSLYSA